MGSFCAAFRQAHCAYVSVFRAGFQEFFILEKNDYEIPFPLFGALFFRRYTSVFEKVNKSTLMFTPITSKIKHVKTNERRGCSNPTALLS